MIIKEVVILNEQGVLNYISDAIHRNPESNVCSIDKIKSEIKKMGVRRPSSNCYGDYQCECFPDWDKVHCFSFVGVYNGYLIVHYNGVAK